MSQKMEINEKTIRITLANFQNELIKLEKIAIENQNVRDCGPMMPLFRRIHWSAAFLGLTDLADIAAGSAVLVSQFLESYNEWSKNNLSILHTILECVKTCMNTQSHMDIQHSNVQHSNQIDDIKALFRQRQINLEAISLCQQRSLEQTKSVLHSIKIPFSVKKKHRPDRTPVLIYLNLEDQATGISGLSDILENSRKKNHILLHGPLSSLSPNDLNEEGKCLYYLVLDISQSGEKWLTDTSLKGRVVSIPQEPDGKPVLEELEIISPREPAVENNFSKLKYGNQPIAGNSLSFDAEGIRDIESLDAPASRRHTSKKHKISNKDLKIRFTVGSKMQIIVSSIIILAMLSLSFVSFFFFRTEIKNRIEDTNISRSNLIAIQTENELMSILDAANLLFQIGSVATGQDTLVDDFYTNSRSLVYVGIPGRNLEFYNRDWFQKNRIFDEEAIRQSIVDFRGSDIDKALKGDTMIINVSPLIPNLESPVLALATPYLFGIEQEVLLILADIGSSLAESISIQEGLATTFIINSNGEVLVHSDLSRVFGGENMKNSPLFTEMYAKGTTRGQIKFTENIANEVQTSLGAFAMIPVGNLGVVSTVVEEEAFRAVNRIQILNFTLLGSILSLTILGVYFFAQSISEPLKELTLATRKIRAKNYAISITPRTSDEIGQLTRHFLRMIPELEKVDRLKDRTSKLINPQVVRMISEDSLPEHAQTKDVTVFFSDIRNFTAMCEKMNDPQVVLNNLSDYFRAVVPCIEKTQGTVDKFIGDAIMAVWGSMKDLQNNAKSAIESALLIREILKKFNIGRGTVTNPIFKAGCGLNSGLVTVGMMGGGAAKEEWAHMGDTVNLASRIESLNKPLGTDILVTQSTFNKVKGIFDMIPMKKVKVKGKVKPQQVYAVLGHLDDDNRPRTLTDLRTLLGITSDFGKNTEMEEYEVKYEISNS